jgi:Trypsin-like peptidase domain
MRSGLLAKVFAVLATLIPASALADTKSSGSGFVIGDGSLIVTAYHVVEGCASIDVPGAGAAVLLKSDPGSDLAILKTKRASPGGLRFRAGHPVRLGEEIIVIGYPLRGLLSTPPTVTTGIVSSLAGIHDDRTEMQISAPVQPGNSGGPVLDRSGNVVGVVESKLDRIKAAAATGDIPENVNFAVHSSIVTSLLDSYTINYDIGSFDQEKPVAEIVAAALQAVVVIECRKEERESLAGPIPKRVPSPPQEANTQSSLSVQVCGRSVEYTMPQTSSNPGLVGVWTGNWSNSGRLCGALIVENIGPNGIANLIYVYGPSRPGSKLEWKQQRATGILNGGELSFQDDQGSTFSFHRSGPETLGAIFEGRSGKLSGSFQQLH